MMRTCGFGSAEAAAGKRGIAQMKLPVVKIISLVTVFSVAMGYLETSVVVYLRELYYPEGFIFPLKIIAPRIALTEIFRELATMLMLVAIGCMSGRTKTEKFAFFIYSFAVWDLSYYVFLKIILNWPGSLFTWDILFMLPTMWVGPVIAPVINSFTMILLSLLIVSRTSQNMKTRIGLCEWGLLILGSLIVIIAYTMEYAAFMAGRFSWLEIFSPALTSAVLEHAAAFTPKRFSWPVFSAGVIVHSTAIVLFFFRKSKQGGSPEQALCP